MPWRFCRAACVCVSALALSLVACDYPRDTEATLSRIRGGVIRVGVIQNPPWAVFSTAGASGIEP